MFFFKKTKRLFTEIAEIKNQLREIEWAHIYHDSIRGKSALESLPLNIGRWAGNYSFFYVLHRILQDYAPQKIAELGLGESTKFISCYIDTYQPNSEHIVVEHDCEWVNSFRNRYSLSDRSTLITCPLTELNVNGFITNSYDGLVNKIKSPFDFYIIDGPFGSERYSRYDIIHLLKDLPSNNEFIILLDDTHRIGEQDTKKAIIALLIEKKIPFHVADYSGNKTNTVIATGNYKHATTL